MVSVFELIPQKLVFGGLALGYHEGQPVLVPQALPGERVEVEQVRRAKGVIHARLAKVLEPSRERIPALCPYYNRCGGCQFQHVSSEKAVEWKSAILRETLSRLGKIRWNGEIPVHSAPPWNYRNQAQLKVGPLADGESGIGFFAHESHRLVDIEMCAILSPHLNLALEALRRLPPEWLRGCGEIAMMADHQDCCTMLHFRGEVEPLIRERIAAEMFRSIPEGVMVAFDEGDTVETLGEPAFYYQVGEFRYQVSPGSFFQVSRFLLPDLVASVTGVDVGEESNRASEPPSTFKSNLETGPASVALDLYAGCGLFSLPLAHRFDLVVGVEAHPTSARDLAENARAHGFRNLKAVHGPVHEFLRRFAGPAPDFVVLDPPRAGVGLPSLRLLAGLQPEHVCYVSCDPSTLARDLGYLARRGYRLRALEMFDLFPQTFHIETVATLRLSPDAPL
jgi:23S rRNA (uracil1939-C5)-methyltransferase